MRSSKYKLILSTMIFGALLGCSSEKEQMVSEEFSFMEKQHQQELSWQATGKNYEQFVRWSQFGDSLDQKDRTLVFIANKGLPRPAEINSWVSQTPFDAAFSKAKAAVQSSEEQTHRSETITLKQYSGWLLINYYTVDAARLPELVTVGEWLTSSKYEGIEMLHDLIVFANESGQKQAALQMANEILSYSRFANLDNAKIDRIAKMLSENVSSYPDIQQEFEETYANREKEALRYFQMVQAFVKTKPKV